jgi:hypothetical protein
MICQISKKDLGYETIALGRTLDRQDMPVTIHFLAISASQLDLGASLSPEIKSPCHALSPPSRTRSK